MTFIVKKIGKGILSGKVSTLPPFYIISGDSYELNPNQSQEVVIRFSPDEATYYNGDLVFSGGGWATRKLIGQGISTCTYQISPKSEAFNCTGGMSSIELTTQHGCSWTALSNCNWIKITSGDSGDGSGLLHYSVLPNPEDLHRAGTLTISGQTVTIHQVNAYPVKLTITPIDKVVNSQAGEITFVVNNKGSGAMDWTGLVIEGDWLQINAGNSGTNNGTIKVSYTGNNGGERIGKIEVTDSDSIGYSIVEGSPATITII